MRGLIDTFGALQIVMHANVGIRGSNTRRCCVQAAVKSKSETIFGGYIVMFYSRIFVKVLALSVAMGSGTAIAESYYVSIDGDDANSGSVDAPFRTVRAARDAIRARNGDMNSDISVYIHGGVYFQSEPLVFNESDSGSNGYRVIYQNVPGEYPVISGGRRIQGWRQDKRGIWKATLNDDAEFRQLYVNGRRATRAKSGIDKYYHLHGLQSIPEFSSAPGARGNDFSNGQALPGSVMHAEFGFTTSAKGMSEWGNQNQIEFIFRKNWRNPRAIVDKIVGNKIYMRQPYWNAQIRIHPRWGIKEGPVFIENAFELLDEPGEWYHDTQDRTLYYMPRTGEKIDELEVIAPILESLVLVKGTLSDRVHDITFRGLQFSHATYMKPSKEGVNDVQANMIVRVGSESTWEGRAEDSHPMPANVSVEAARDIVIEGCVFTHLGSAGLDLIYTQNVLVRRNVFSEISGTGLQVLGKVSEPSLDSPEKLSIGNTITDNFFSRAPLEYLGGHAIFVGYTKNTTVSHNEVYDVPYSAIAVGWGWGRRPNVPASGNRITHNRIINYMTQLDDGGGVYTLGTLGGDKDRTIIAENYFKSERPDPGPVFCGIYLDNGSSYIDVERNVVQLPTGAMPSRWSHAIRQASKRTNRHVNVRDNYINKAPGPISFFGTNVVVERHTVVPEALWPEEALEIIENTGIRSDTADGINHAPMLRIDWLENGEVVTPWNSERYGFQGVAYDPEDGRLTGANLTWLSSKDGVIGHGESTRLARPLSIGKHEITLLANDRNGRQSKARIHIEVAE